MRKRISRTSVKKFVEECLASGMTSPSEMRDAYEKQWKKSLSADAFEKATRRLGYSSDQVKQLKEESKKQTVCKDISEYRQYQTYKLRSQVSGITEEQMKKQLNNMRKLWEIMGCTNPEEWTYEELIEQLSKENPLVADERGRMKFREPYRAQPLFSALNTMFPNILPKGWYGDFSREAGELKDYFTFEEYAEFKVNLHDTQTMPKIGWCALFDAQVNGGMREGSRMTTGIMSLRWENINYETRRCSIRDKGGRGKAARLWKNVPLDLFPWLDGWNELLKWHRAQYGYTPTNERHATGRVFPFHYQLYSDMFHATRRRCNCRIAQDSETRRPHILRRTHAQWLVKFHVPLEQICGQFPDGFFGVGWNNPKILLDFYITIAPLSAWEKATLETVAFNPRLEESSNLLCRNVE